MNFIDVSFFSADTFDARRMSIASKPSRGTATSTNPYIARRWLGAANRKLASRSCIEIILESDLSAELTQVSAPNALFRLQQKCAFNHRANVRPWLIIPPE